MFFSLAGTSKLATPPGHDSVVTKCFNACQSDLGLLAATQRTWHNDKQDWETITTSTRLVYERFVSFCQGARLVQCEYFSSCIAGGFFLINIVKYYSRQQAK